ncbi:hypothetical protein GALMADRAFT_1364509 [Galerina marginata CBS 339.88]|uniref:Uncharacterized protein n=1 Tax=Galerina marginata (strain CBS 339.88) TaxID=685588 RepID=A0A067S6V9_GALM3|nr:hypothetical protein GALMADRAFT_1364509 [Galerina marginata CBS 339.88]
MSQQTSIKTVFNVTAATKDEEADPTRVEIIPDQKPPTIATAAVIAGPCEPTPDSVQNFLMWLVYELDSYQLKGGLCSRKVRNVGKAVIHKSKVWAYNCSPHILGRRTQCTKNGNPQAEKGKSAVNRETKYGIGARVRTGFSEPRRVALALFRLPQAPRFLSGPGQVSRSGMVVLLDGRFSVSVQMYNWSQTPQGNPVIQLAILLIPLSIRYFNHIGLLPSKKRTKPEDLQTPKFHHGKLFPSPEPKKKKRQRKRNRQTEIAPARLPDEVIYPEDNGAVLPDIQLRFGSSSGVDGDYISLQIDLFYLVEFGEEIRAFVSQCNIMVSSVVIQFHDDDHHVLGEEHVLLSLTSLFAALVCLSSIDIRQMVRDPDEINPRRSVRHKIHGFAQIFPQEVYNQEVFFNRMVKTMKEVLFLSIHVNLFQTATLRNILPSFVKGLSICEVDLEFSDITACADIFSTLHCPSMEKFRMIVWHRAPLLLPEVFIDRHRLLDSLQLLSRAGRTKVQAAPGSQVLLLPESLKSVQITANYAGWIMGDISTLSSFDIHPLTKTVRPQYPEYCDAVVLLVWAMKSSSHLDFSGEFVLTIYFPANLTRHIEFFSRSDSQQCKCALDQHVSESPIRNVHALELDIDRLDGRSFFRKHGYAITVDFIDSIEPPSSKSQNHFLAAWLGRLNRCYRLITLKRHVPGCKRESAKSVEIEIGKNTVVRDKNIGTGVVLKIPKKGKKWLSTLIREGENMVFVSTSGVAKTGGHQSRVENREQQSERSSGLCQSLAGAVLPITTVEATTGMEERDGDRAEGIKRAKVATTTVFTELLEEERAGVRLVAVADGAGTALSWRQLTLSMFVTKKADPGSADLDMIGV